MKRLSLLIVTTLSFLSPKSQQLSSNRTFDNFFANKAPGSSNGPASTIENQAKWKLVFKSDNGNVFESPIDKMRCTAFNFKAKMPVAGAALNPESSTGTGFLSMPNPMLKDLSIPAPLSSPGLAIITR